MRSERTVGASDREDKTIRLRWRCATTRNQPDILIISPGPRPCHPDSIGVIHVRLILASAHRCGIDLPAHLTSQSQPSA
jgi:anthranilate/para-aminobenzoate synthase component II